MFIFNTDLLLINVTWWQGIIVFIVATVAILIFTAGTMGWFITKSRIYESVALVLIAWGIFKISIRLPLKLFFQVNSVFLYLLAIVFAGKGVAALQEGNVFPVDPVNFPRIELLGIYPNLESLGLQLAMVLIAGVWGAFSYLKTNRKVMV